MIWAFQTATLSQSIFSLTSDSLSSLWNLQLCWHIVKNMCLTTRERERENQYTRYSLESDSRDTLFCASFTYSGLPRCSVFPTYYNLLCSHLHSLLWTQPFIFTCFYLFSSNFARDWRLSLFSYKYIWVSHIMSTRTASLTSSSITSWDSWGLNLQKTAMKTMICF